MRYMVWFKDCPEQVEFESLKEARHYAKLNSGCIFDREAGETIEEYQDVWE